MLQLLVRCILLIHCSLAAFHQKDTFPLDSRIIGGDVASIIDYPYQVSLEYHNNHRCGGAIIGREWILTAAHCLIDFGYPPAENFRVRAGTSYRGIGGQVLNVTAFTPHSNYDSFTYDFDIAVLRLGEPIALSSSAQIVRLPDSANANIDGALANVTGWGSTVEGGSASSVLRVIEIPIISQSVCRDLYSGYQVTDRMICAGLWDGGQDACSGDGGGPLIIDSVLTGTVSWGLGCARPQAPGVYANVGAFRDWITEKTGI